MILGSIVERVRCQNCVNPNKSRNSTILLLTLSKAKVFMYCSLREQTFIPHELIIVDVVYGVIVIIGTAFNTLLA